MIFVCLQLQQNYVTVCSNTLFIPFVIFFLIHLYWKYFIFHIPSNFNIYIPIQEIVTLLYATDETVPFKI